LIAFFVFYTLFYALFYIIVQPVAKRQTFKSKGSLMMLPPRFLEAFGPPTPPKIYDTPPFVVVSPRWPRFIELALHRHDRDEPEVNLEVCARRSLPVAVKGQRR
jgi:hypothetical protein